MSQAATLGTPARQQRSEDRRQMLDELQKVTFGYFIHQYNSDNGLVADKSVPDWPASIAATGFGLTVYPIGVKQGWLEREDAVQRTLATLRFFWQSEQSQRRRATGYRGFYYHFLDMRHGRRAWNSELSTIDTAFLIMGVLVAAQYFDQESEVEQEIRDLADRLYRRVDWAWALNGRATICHGWRPEHGFLKYHWEGYDESLLLYILALGSPTFPIPRESYHASVAHYAWKKIYDIEFLYAGPLFIHQYPHVWIDFRAIQDRYMRDRGSDYFENSRLATQVQQEYAIRNPREFVGYGKDHWGVTASDGPGPAVMKVSEIERVFYDYIARGVPYGPDDGTIAPWAAVTSLPFAPEIVLPTIQHFNELELQAPNSYGYKATINQTYPVDGENKFGWVSDYHFGINQGPIIMMIENYQTGFIWELMRGCRYLGDGLRKAGFEGGWLSN